MTSVQDGTRFTLRQCIQMAPVKQEPNEDGISLLPPDDEQVFQIKADLDWRLGEVTDHTTCIELVRDVYVTNGLELPQHHAGIVGALIEMKKAEDAHASAQESGGHSDGSLDIDVLAFLLQQMFKGGGASFDELLSPTKLDDPLDQKVTDIAEFYGLQDSGEDLIWLKDRFQKHFRGPEYEERILAPIRAICFYTAHYQDIFNETYENKGQFYSALESAFKKADFKIDFDFSRFGGEEEKSELYIREGVYTAINEEVFIPMGFNELTKSYIFEQESLTSPAGREIRFFIKEAQSRRSHSSSFTTANVYMRDASFYTKLQLATQLQQKNAREYAQNKPLDNLSDYILGQDYHTTKKGGTKFSYEKLDELVYLERCDLTQATEAILGRRLYKCFDKDKLTQLRTFFKEDLSFLDSADTEVISKVTDDYVLARSFLIALKRTNNPLMVFSQYAYDIYLSDNELPESIKKALTLLFSEMEDKRFIQRLENHNSEEFSKLLEGEIRSQSTGADRIEQDSTLVNAFNEKLRTAASKALEAFTYEDLGKVPGMPPDWRDRKVDWAPVNVF